MRQLKKPGVVGLSCKLAKFSSKHYSSEKISLMMHFTAVLLRHKQILQLSIFNVAWWVGYVLTAGFKLKRLEIISL